MPLFVMIAVVLTLMSSLFLMGNVNAAINSPVLKYELTGQNVNLTWDAVANASSYNVYYSTNNSTFALLGSTSATHYVYTQPWNTTRYYYVVAVNGTNTSAPSNVVKVTTPAQSSSSGGAAAGWAVGGIVIPVYMPYFWLGVFLIIVGMLLIGYGHTGKKHRHWEGFGALAFMFGVLIALASVVLPYFHLL